MNLIEIVNKTEELKKEKEYLILLHKESIKSIDNKIKKLNEEKNFIGNGLNTELIAIAEKVIIVSGDAAKIKHGGDYDQNRASVRKKAIEDAIIDLANGGGELMSRYIGVKNYSGFGDQREDHKYGLGPKHGSIVFSIKLKDKAKLLTKEEIEAAIYYLNSIVLIQANKLTA